MNQAATYPIVSPADAAPTLGRPSKISATKLIVFLALHIPLAVVLKAVPMLAFAHALGSFALGMVWAASGRQVHRAAWAGAYIAGGEVLWRMTNTSIALPWEFGKYAMSFIFITSMVRRGQFTFPPSALLFFAMLVPAAIITFAQYEWYYSRRFVSAYLSGPLALIIAVGFFSRLRVTPYKLFFILVALMGPIVSVATLCFRSTFGAANVAFGSESSVETSGGFGPNQVSATLGLGMLASLFCQTDEKTKLIHKMVLLAVTAFFAVQSALTLSRTGLYLAVAGAAAGGIYILRNNRMRMNLIGGVLVLFVVGKFVLVPWLDNFTGGALTARFSDTGLTNREKIAKTDLQMFMDNPLTGVGIGLSGWERLKYGERGAAHTEFTRLLAEHGIFGLGAIFSLGLLGIHIFRKARSIKGRALVAGMFAFSMLFMAASAMRLVLPSFTFGLAAIALLPEKRKRRGSAPQPPVPSPMPTPQPA